MKGKVPSETDRFESTGYSHSFYILLLLQRIMKFEKIYG